MTDKKKKRWVTHFEGNCSQEQKKKMWNFSAR